MEVVHCKDCEYYTIFADGSKHCGLLHGILNAKEDDFCSFASTEDNEDAGFDCDYKGVRCKDCGWYDGYYEECICSEDIPYVGLCDPQPYDYCSRAERKIENE